MTNFLLRVLSGMMLKYKYARDLLKRAEGTVREMQAHKSTIDHPLIDPVLLTGLEKVSHDLGSVDLLRSVTKLRDLNATLKNINPDDTNNVLDTAMKLKTEMPKMAAELKASIQRCAWKSLCCFGLAALIIISLAVVALTRL